MMKVHHLNYFDDIGGSGRAGYRIHHALRKAGVESKMLVKETVTSDWTVQILRQKSHSIVRRIQGKLINKLMNQFHTTNPILHSPDVFSLVDVKKIYESDANIIHLHWFHSGMVSIADIGKFKKPIVWTLHDMWAFCGAEHYTEEFRWKEGYQKDNRPDYESGFDLNRWTWNRKRKHWTHPMHIVTPSQWLADCVQQSALMSDWPVTVIPHTLDTNLWQPLKRRVARQILKLPKDSPLLLFGAIGGGNDPRKGFDLLEQALSHLRGEVEGLELVVFGQFPPEAPPNLGFPVHYMGYLHDDISLRLCYSATDAMLVPSRQEAFGQTASEAHACGTPVVAFNAGGLPDIVDHLNTGYLAEPFDTVDLARGIKWVLEKREDGILRDQARKRAVKLFNNNIVAKKYIAVYQQVMNK